MVGSQTIQFLPWTKGKALFAKIFNGFLGFYDFVFFYNNTSETYIAMDSVQFAVGILIAAAQLAQYDEFLSFSIPFSLFSFPLKYKI